MTKENGGAAFPVAAGPGQQFTQGMSLRDWFAGQAMAAITGSSKSGGWNIGNQGADNATIANAAYVIADAMLAEREKGG